MAKEFTGEDDEHLAQYIAINDRKEADGRIRQDLYKQLVEDPDRWPWSVRHTWISWMERYTDNHQHFDRRVHVLQEKNCSDSITQPSSSYNPGRTKFTAKEDKNLIRFLAKLTPSKLPNVKFGRSGNYIYQNVLVANPNKYPWAKTHTWQSWRSRYVKRIGHFDTLISQWQERHGVGPDMYKNTLEDFQEELDLQLGQTDKQQCALDESLHNAEHGAKRRRLEEEGEEEEMADIVSDGVRLPKRRKTLPSSSEDEAEDPTGMARRSGSISPVDVANGINPGEGREDMDELVGRREPEACKVEEDNECDEKLSQRSNYSGGQQGPVHMHKDCHDFSNTLPAFPERNDSLEGRHIRVRPTTPARLQEVQNQSLASSNMNDTLADVHTSEITPMDVQVPVKQTGALPPPPESSPARIRRGDLDTSGNAIDVPKTSQDLTSQPIAVGRSHHPTPPSTNVQSEWSLQSPSTVSDSSMLTVKAEEKSRHLPPVFPVYGVASPSPSPVDPTTTYPDHLVETRLASAKPKPPLFASPTFSDPFLESPTLPQRITDLRELEENSPSHSLDGTARNRTPKKDGGYESGSDELFTSSSSSSSSPRRPEVIHGLPKSHLGISFRGSNWFRERKVVSGSIVQKNFKRDATSRNGKDEDARSYKTASGQVREAQAEKRRLNKPRLLDVVNDNLSDGSSTSTVEQRPSRSAASGNSKHVNTGQQNVTAAGPTPIPVTHELDLIDDSEVEDVPGDTRSQSQHFKKEHMAVTRKVADVFRTLTPVASGNTRDPYVLTTAHLPEPSSGSSAIRVQLDSPVPRHKAPRDKGRRQTFAGFKSRSSLPSIDLVKKLGKRASTGTETQFQSRRTPLDNTSNSDSIVSIVQTPLAAPERRVTRYRPPRSSVIPVLADPESQHPTSALLPKWSPSTYNHVIRAGLGAIFKRMEENHGFSASVVQRAWLQQNMDLDATDRLLLRMRIAAENASHGDDYAEQHGLASTKALEGTRNETPSLGHNAPDPGATSDDYSPPARSKAERYRKVLEHGHFRRARPPEIDLVSRGSPKSSTRKKGLPPAVWGAKDDEALRSGDKAKLKALADRFGEDTVRRRFLVIMRESRVIK